MTQQQQYVYSDYQQEQQQQQQLQQNLSELQQLKKQLAVLEKKINLNLTQIKRQRYLKHHLPILQKQQKDKLQKQHQQYKLKKQKHQKQQKEKIKKLNQDLKKHRQENIRAADQVLTQTLLDQDRQLYQTLQRSFHQR
jgi:hypothetical protein